MTDFEWTDEPPEEPGWYWVYNHLLKVGPKLKEVYRKSGLLRVRDTHGYSARIEDLEDEVSWAGPIPEPTGPDA